MGEAEQPDAGFGFDVASAGDVNGDGYDDVVVGAPWFDDGERDEGKAFVYLGSPSGPSVTADWTAGSGQVSGILGDSVASGGDVNGDGYDDLVVGVPGYDGGELDEGAAFLYLGSASGLAAVPDWVAESDQVGCSLGTAVAPAGDLNGDGYADLVVGAEYYDGGETSEGGAFVYLGSSTGPSPVADWATESNEVEALLGGAVASAGDVNADGYDDLIVGARGGNAAELDVGAAFLYLGSPSGPSPSADWTVGGDHPGSMWGPPWLLRAT